MFEVPDAKRVRRSDLYASEHSDNEESSKSDTTAQDALRAQLAALYGPIEIEPSTAPEPATEPEAEVQEEEEAFEFNLFAPSAPQPIPAPGDQDGMTIETPKKPQKIILEKDDDVDVPVGKGKLVRQREDGWWMADITEARMAEFQDVAVGMEDIRRWAEMRHYGWERPWKVRIVRTGLSPAEVVGAARTAAIARHLKLDSMKTADGMDVDDKVKSKTKPNKKRRIILRSRAKAAKEAAEAARIKAEKDREVKLSADADYAVKRNARNRERKIKRREREKRKKEAAKNGTVFVDEGSDVEKEQNEGGKEMEVAA